MTSVQVNIPSSKVKSQLTPSKRVAFLTMGCKVNAFETEVMAQKLTNQPTKEAHNQVNSQINNNLSYERVSASDHADLYVINTCTVTAEADRQARQQVRKVIRKNPDARVVVTGCYAQMDPDACSSIPGVDLVVGNSEKLDIPYLLDDLDKGRLPPVLMRDIDKEISLPDQLLHGFEGRTRAFVQIQQGCDQGCTFCIIHTARGPNRSFPAGMIVRQCERLIMNGYCELVLCGVDIGSYGSDVKDDHHKLTDLLKALVKLDGDFRIRLSSIDPAHITDDLISFLENNKIICPQLHLSLQSANTLILKRMKRRATRELLYDRISRLREAVPNLVLSADILVGFPTETDAHFNDTLTAIHELEIPYPHVFSYSSRPGTPAARIPSQVPKSIRKQRAQLARDAGKQVWQKVAHKQLGQIQRVLIESVPDTTGNEAACGKYIGRMDNYFPVEIEESPYIDGNWVNVKISEIGDGKLSAVKPD